MMCVSTVTVLMYYVYTEHNFGHRRHLSARSPMFSLSVSWIITKHMSVGEEVLRAVSFISSIVFKEPECGSLGPSHPAERWMRKHSYCKWNDKTNLIGCILTLRLVYFLLSLCVCVGGIMFLCMYVRRCICARLSPVNYWWLFVTSINILCRHLARSRLSQ